MLFVLNCVHALSKQDSCHGTAAQLWSSHEAVERCHALNNLSTQIQQSASSPGFESKIGIPPALVGVEQDGSAASEYCLCCLADHSGRPYGSEDVLAIPTTSTSTADRCRRQLAPLVAPMAMIFSYYVGIRSTRRPSTMNSGATLTQPGSPW